MYESCVSFDHGSAGDGFYDGTLLTKDIINLNTMTFTLNVKIIDIFDKNGNNLNVFEIFNHVTDHKSIDDIYAKSCHYLTWNIDQDKLNKIKIAKENER